MWGSKKSDTLLAAHVVFDCCMRHTLPLTSKRMSTRVHSTAQNYGPNGRVGPAWTLFLHSGRMDRWIPSNGTMFGRALVRHLKSGGPLHGDEIGHVLIGVWGLEPTLLSTSDTTFSRNHNLPGYRNVRF